MGIENEVRKNILRMAVNCGLGGAHLGGSLSSVELLSVLYRQVLRYHFDDPNWFERDRFLMSKGHAAMALYCVLAECGIIRKEELLSYKKDGSRLGVHPSLNGVPGIEIASGSLGQGLSIGVGECIALKRKGNTVSRVFVYMGDGECNEGSVWEAALAAAHYECANLTAIIDMNGLQYDGDTSLVMNMKPLKNKWNDFGWEAIEINGHNTDEILNALMLTVNKPQVIIAKTTKGKGVSFMENKPEFHHAVLSQELFEKAMLELEQEDA